MTRRKESREAKQAETANNNKKKIQNLQKLDRVVHREMKKGRRFKYSILNLKLLVTWKMSAPHYTALCKKKGNKCKKVNKGKKNSLPIKRMIFSRNTKRSMPFLACQYLQLRHRRRQ